MFVSKICSHQGIGEDDFQPEHSAHSKLIVQEAQTKILILYPLKIIDISHSKVVRKRTDWFLENEIILRTPGLASLCHRHQQVVLHQAHVHHLESSGSGFG